MLCSKLLFRKQWLCVPDGNSALTDIRNKLQLWGVGNNDTEKIITVLIKENFINE